MTSRSGKGKKGDWKPKYSTDGYGYFEIDAFVQKVKEYAKLKADFVEFYIEKADDEVGSTYHNLSVRIPHALDVLLTEGDHVFVTGYITSIWLEDMHRTLYEMVATDVKDASGSCSTIPKEVPSKDDVPF